MPLDGDGDAAVGNNNNDISPELMTQDVQLLILQTIVKDTKEPQELAWLMQSPDILKVARETNEKLFEDTHGGEKFDRNEPNHLEWFNLNAQLWYASIVYKLMKLKMNIGNKGSKDPTINDAHSVCNLCQTTWTVMKHKINQQCVSFSISSYYDLIAYWLETSAVPDVLDKFFNSEFFEKKMEVGVMKDQIGDKVIANDYHGMLNPLWNVKTGKRSLQVPKDLSNIIISFLKPKIGNHTEHEKEEVNVWLKFLFGGDQQICNAYHKLDQRPDPKGHKCLSCTKLTSFMKCKGKTSLNGPYLANVDVSREMDSMSELSASMVKEMNDLLCKRNAFKESGRFMFPLALSNATILSTLSNLKSTSHIESSPAAGHISSEPLLPPDLNPISSPPSLSNPTIVTLPDPNPISQSSSLSKVINKNMKKEAKLPSFPFIHTIPKALRDLRKRRKPFKELPSTMKRLSNQSPNANKERNSAVICSHCGYGFKTYEECEEHRKYCDYPADIRSLLNICQFCYNGFSTTQSLWRHETKDCKLNPDISDETSKKKSPGRPKKSKSKTQSESSSDNMNEDSDEKQEELEEEDEDDETFEIEEEEFEKEEESEVEDEEEDEDEDEDEDDETETESEQEVEILDLTNDSD